MLRRPTVRTWCSMWHRRRDLTYHRQAPSSARTCRLCRRLPLVIVRSVSSRQWRWVVVVVYYQVLCPMVINPNPVDRRNKEHRDQGTLIAMKTTGASQCGTLDGGPVKWTLPREVYRLVRDTVIEIKNPRVHFAHCLWHLRRPEGVTVDLNQA